ncbi:MAG: hypothetical protein OXU71_07345 [Gammaproteobacteria bacterium]|nr:hypothetical protein [Gammaproteobacteria bacterium]
MKQKNSVALFWRILFLIAVVALIQFGNKDGLNFSPAAGSSWYQLGWSVGQFAFWLVVVALLFAGKKVQLALLDYKRSKMVFKVFGYLALFGAGIALVILWEIAWFLLLFMLIGSLAFLVPVAFVHFVVSRKRIEVTQVIFGTSMLCWIISVVSLHQSMGAFLAHAVLIGVFCAAAICITNLLAAKFSRTSDEGELRDE